MKTTTNTVVETKEIMIRDNDGYPVFMLLTKYHGKTTYCNNGMDYSIYPIYFDMDSNRFYKIDSQYCYTESITGDYEYCNKILSEMIYNSDVSGGLINNVDNDSETILSWNNGSAKLTSRYSQKKRGYEQREFSVIYYCKCNEAGKFDTGLYYIGTTLNPKEINRFYDNGISLDTVPVEIKPLSIRLKEENLSKIINHDSWM